MTKTNWTKGSQMIDLEKMKLQAYRGSFTSGQALDLIEAYEALQSRLESLEKDAARCRAIEYKTDTYHIEVRRGDCLVRTELSASTFEACKVQDIMARDVLLNAISQIEFAMQARKGASE